MMRLILRRVTLRQLVYCVALATFLTLVLLTNRSWSNSDPHFTGSRRTVRPGVKTYVGNTGQFTFYRLQARNSSLDPDTMKLCRETRLTQCNAPARRPDSERQKDRSRRPPYKLAMLRNPPFLSGDPDFLGCEYDNCEFVGTGSQFAKDADALFVYVVGMNDRDFPLPPGRKPHQTYFMGSWEAPIFTQATFLDDSASPWNSAFNASITYRLDSDMVYGYGKLDFQPPTQERRPDYLKIARNKTKTAVWIVSNCGSPSRRNEYVKEMQKYIDIDVFGKCGMPCEVFDEVCVPDFVDTYRFYLSFENSHCTDYITEKFFKLYIDGSHIVPVVRGGVDYKREFPEKSLINTADFKSPRELALFLKALAADDVEYSRYLEVKDRYRAIMDGNRFCHMCEYLHKNDGKTRVIPDAKKWYKDDHCWQANDV